MSCRSDAWLWIFRTGVGLILLASLLFLIGFATNNWSSQSGIKFGLWETCSGLQCSSLVGDVPAYLGATQGFQIIALAMYTLSPIVHFFVFMGVKPGDGPKSRIFDVGYSIGVVFHLCSVLIFGLEVPHPDTISWSFNMSAASVGLAAVGIVLAIVSRKKALRKFTLFSKQNRMVTPLPNDSASVGGSSSGTHHSHTPVKHDKTFGPADRHPRHSPDSFPSNSASSVPSTSYAHQPTRLHQQHLQPPEAFPRRTELNPSSALAPISLGPIRGTVPSAPPIEEPPTYDEAMSQS
ncbi:uncharacterized protein LOC106057872 isoform X1 [Biomphalaria glabrata]|uniref:Uncharacterized protein LOC106057872 isoform X1 n=1 Tax=Biomphalaria glabrata TaxID=6526 RepID=A0A9W2ZIN8_BIOGL|nr:uncharacterized protein LOC106057872 isoform X1 [Biomphalaria glabrata]XP_055874854.1 uncharacterized protein LOC106057872 isoform X1 [Biomphalaria glabrata]XP_055874855.1 uncharacterized protein LOC106057872 isoform X1 [Biomphalaria glabrata]XP_055874856.1 uncharacterized protein LOC106057872 isoform X1 [Biomphalaria glabrata]KAI8766848.1 leucine-rich repeat extensin-like protein 5 [Biomphalaria glabrata]